MHPESGAERTGSSRKDSPNREWKSRAGEICSKIRRRRKRREHAPGSGCRRRGKLHDVHPGLGCINIGHREILISFLGPSTYTVRALHLPWASFAQWKMEQKYGTLGAETMEQV